MTPCPVRLALPVLASIVLATALPLALEPLVAQQPEAPLPAPPAAERGPLLQPGAAHLELVPDSGRGAAAGDLSDLLTGRLPGLVVQQRSGALGAGADIRVRSRSTSLLSSDPVVFVDGVRVDSRSVTSSLLGSYAAPSALDAIGLEEIERIEVLPGPAAAWGYGAGSASGVVLVTTRRPEQGRLRWRTSTEQGATFDVATYPENVSGWGTTATGPSAACFYYRQVAGDCTLDSLVSFNPIERASPFRTARSSRVGVSGTGGTPIGALRLAVRHEAEDGVLETAARRALRASAGIASRPLPTLGLDARVAYLQAMLRSPEVPDFMNVLESGLLGSASDDPAQHGFREPLETILGARPRHGADRLMLGASADWRPLPWLTADATAGIERSDVSEDFYHATQVEGSPDPYELFRNARSRYTTYTFDASATAGWMPASTLRAATTLGASQHRIQARRRSFERNVHGFPYSESSEERWSDASTLALTLQQRLDWRERVAASVGVRAENPDRGVTLGNIAHDVLPAASIAWELGREPFFPRSRILETVRLRAAWAEVSRPIYGLMDLPFEYLFGAAPEDERTREIEAGIDLGALDGRAALSLTVYRQRTGNAILPVPIASPSGFYAEARNAGVVHSQGATAQLALALLRGAKWSWDATLQGSLGSNELTGLYGVTPFSAPVGESIDARSERPVSSAWDRNSDGVIAPDEVVLGSITFAGSSFPRQEAALWTRVGLTGRGALSFLLDYRGAFEQANRTAWLRCRSALCAEAYDDALAVEEQIRLASMMIYDLAPGINENGRFVRLREVALSLDAPSRWAAGLGASSARLTVAGRNLALWTPYGGLDPEVRAAAPTNFPASATVGDYFAPPLTRELTARLELAW